MKAQSAKAKGRKLQNDVVEKILRQLQAHEDNVRSTSMGAPGVDILLSTEMKKIFPFSIECKNQERAGPIYTWFSQACKNCCSATKPLLVIKANRKEPLAVLSFKDFLNTFYSGQEK